MDIFTDPSSIEARQTKIALLEGRMREDVGKAAFELSILCDSQQKVMYYSRTAFGHLMREAEVGNGESMHLVAIYYQGGWPPVQFDADQFVSWSEKSVEAGYLFAANDLYSIYSDRNSSEYYNPTKASDMLELLKKNDLLVVPEDTDAVREQMKMAASQSCLYGTSGNN